MPKRFSRADLHKFLQQTPDPSDVIRNHAFSKIGRGGEAKGLSVERRRDMESRRRTIADYRRSKLGGLQDRPVLPNIMPDKPEGAGANDGSDNSIIGNRQQGGIKDKSQEDTKSIERRHHFIEPPKRNFDKFS